jgi:chromate transporter
LTLIATRWGQRRRDTRFVRAFKTGLTPLTIGLLVATGWLLARPYVDFSAQGAGAMAVILVSIALMLRTRLSPMWMVAFGAVVGALGWA